MQNNPNNEETYYNIRDNMVINNYLDNAKRFFYQRKTCYRGMLRYNKKGKFNIPFGRYKKCNYEDLKNILPEVKVGEETIDKEPVDDVALNPVKPITSAGEIVQTLGLQRHLIMNLLDCPPAVLYSAMEHKLVALIRLEVD